MIKKLVVPEWVTQTPPARVAVRCPHCGKEAVMEPLQEHDLNMNGNYTCGQRRCPNPQCRGHLFIVLPRDKPAIAYPPIKLDFDPENIPAKILTTFEEAITCHAVGCFVASAIMVRRTFEEVCADRGVKGNNLKERIANLQSKIVIPRELLDAMDELRILGNDAAHIEAKDYESVSKKEATIAIKFTKEILKSLYQYKSLLEELKSSKQTL